MTKTERINIKAEKINKLRKEAYDNENIKIDENYNPVKKYETERLKFINFCVEFRLSYETIGKLLHLSKVRIYQIYRYGNKRLTRRNKISILERDNNRCLVCRKKGSKTEHLHIHHIKTPKIKNKNNLVTLCSSCHIKIEQLNRKDAEFKEFFGKKLSTLVSLQK